jgi:hypothetical protein
LWSASRGGRAPYDSHFGLTELSAIIREIEDKE